MSQLNISVDAREDVGRGANRRLRGSGKVPGVIYSKGESRAVSVDNKDLAKLWRDLIGRTPLIVINEGKEELRALIKEVQRDPIKDTFLHVDFHEVTAGEEITSNAALHTIGEPFGVKNEGGTLEVHLHEVEVRSQPRNIPDYIEIDVSELGVGDAIHVGELPKLEGVEYLQNDDALVVSVVGFTAELETVEAPEAEEADEAAETETDADSEEEEA